MDSWSESLRVFGYFGGVSSTKKPKM